MIERPILFNTAMVQAILSGQKTQTRRVLKVQPPVADKPIMPLYQMEPEPKVTTVTFHEVIDGDMPHPSSISQHKSPFGKIGDHLWVRETFSSCFEVDIPQGRPVGAFDTKGSPAKPEWKTRFIYKADGPMPNVQWSFVGDSSPVCWQSPIFMPRIASRILLEITNIRVERLNDISEEDAMAEGVEQVDYQHQKFWKGYKNKERAYRDTAKDSFKSLWQEINGSDSWTVNPWVWVIEFKVIQGGVS